MCTARAQTSVIEPWEIGGLDLWSTIVPRDRAAERGGKKCRGRGSYRREVNGDRMSKQQGTSRCLSQPAQWLSV